MIGGSQATVPPTLHRRPTNLTIPGGIDEMDQRIDETVTIPLKRATSNRAHGAGRLSSTRVKLDLFLGNGAELAEDSAFRKSSMKRAKLAGPSRNSAVVIGDAGTYRLILRLRLEEGFPTSQANDQLGRATSAEGGACDAQEGATLIA